MYRVLSPERLCLSVRPRHPPRRRLPPHDPRRLRAQIRLSHFPPRPPPCPAEANCHFLFEGGCSIHEAKPTQCRIFPFWPELVESRREWKKTAALLPGHGQRTPHPNRCRPRAGPRDAGCVPRVILGPMHPLTRRDLLKSRRSSPRLPARRRAVLARPVLALHLPGADLRGLQSALLSLLRLPGEEGRRGRESPQLRFAPLSRRVLLGLLPYQIRLPHPSRVARATRCARPLDLCKQAGLKTIAYVPLNHPFMDATSKDPRYAEWRKIDRRRHAHDHGALRLREVLRRLPELPGPRRHPHAGPRSPHAIPGRRDVLRRPLSGHADTPRSAAAASTARPLTRSASASPSRGSERHRVSRTGWPTRSSSPSCARSAR